MSKENRTDTNRSEDLQADPANLLSNRPFIICLLYLATYITVFSLVIGVVLAYAYKESAVRDWEGSHFSYHIRTFWLLLVGFAIAFALGMAFVVLQADEAILTIGIAYVGVLLLSVGRTVFSMTKAVRHQPMPRPRTLLI